MKILQLSYQKVFLINDTPTIHKGQHLDFAREAGLGILCSIVLTCFTFILQASRKEGDFLPNS